VSGRHQLVARPESQYSATDFDAMARFYRVEYPESADHGFLLRWASRPGVQSILEIPCGAGRNAEVLTRGGARLTAVDSSPAMVTQTAQAIAGLAQSRRAVSVVGDLRRLQLNELFDLIVVPREAFQLLGPDEDVEEALAGLSGHLRPGGVLILDLANFDRKDCTTPGLLPDYYSPTAPDGVLLFEWTRSVGEGVVLSRRRIQNHISADFFHVSFYYDIVEDSSLVDTRMLQIRFRRYPVDDIRRRLERRGLTIIGVYGDYDDNSLAADSVRAIVVARK
jgi:SAM-dependent methyltransferase